MKCNAVFQGGGIRGIGFVGALSCFQKNGYTWNQTAGTSAGALIAALIAAGYTTKEIEKIMVETDFLKFLDKSTIQRIPILGNLLGVFKEKGIYSGEYFEKWAKKLLSKKGIVKFNDVSENGESRLKIIAADITKKKTLILPDSLVEYGIDPMEFEIATALRMSISIPFYFKPVKFEYEGGTSYIVDGGVCWNYPLTIFDVEGIPEIPTVGFKFINSINDYTGVWKTDIMSFLFDIAGTVAARDDLEKLDKKDMERTVFISADNVEVTEFNISKQKSIKLFKSGYRSARNFLENWDFEEYISKYPNISSSI
ncbi:patatin-like phospholipase family protein [Clostridium aestuarii]|uniref:Patatin-like phospholipase family protein n=1 Tax=Clostridium aestuarii TaxID=338193 RepID=A0ABT4CZE3_9CLOT|nr:patatin-like phospholipase family protein [Clostridium aestuarii]MCY6483173.1 patatin-like phospholipase family protein [Clostridium aestuarii]